MKKKKKSKKKKPIQIQHDADNGWVIRIEHIYSYICSVPQKRSTSVAGRLESQGRQRLDKSDAHQDTIQTFAQSPRQHQYTSENPYTLYDGEYIYIRRTFIEGWIDGKPNRKETRKLFSYGWNKGYTNHTTQGI
ncbi:uncharacterized protein LOC117185972 [Drosophila miranda]|uniref:uncharacterized protein LOC117185972 n=1 Tax=Drosophila miranda TaxID=7229 RepID=UPI00143F5CA2|nr:uncharacterized protein LOC117185972 [Drosophila miranda]